MNKFYATAYAKASVFTQSKASIWIDLFTHFQPTNKFIHTLGIPANDSSLYSYTDLDWNGNENEGKSPANVFDNNINETFK